jgi:hypothetical protein
MCWKRKPKPEPVVYGDKVALLFGINNYPGAENDLSGCLNDIKDVAAKLNETWGDFQIRKFEDSNVTRERFKTELANAIAGMPEDTTVVIFLDSCFSGSATRNNPTKIKARFHDPGFKRPRKTRKMILRSGEMKWLCFAGCGEHQTSADAYFADRPNGADTYYTIRCLRKGIDYDTLIELINGFLPSALFNQAPTLEGPEVLRLRQVFEGPTLIVWYSGHGSYVKDIHGDEEDGVDETLYLYDGNLVDDDINNILQSIK